MEKEKLVNVVKDVENKSNKELFEVRKELLEEFEKTKQLIIELTIHLEGVETFFNNVNDEINKRTKK